MKKLLCIALSAIFTAGAFASCQSTSPKFSPKISVTSSEAEEYATWLTNRLGTVSEKLTLGTGDSAGIDMTEFENDGYVIRSRGDETVISGKTGEGLDLAVRKYAKAAGNGVGCGDTVYHEGYRIERLTIADVDISEYTIYYSPDANQNMKFAVSEFQRLVKKACGAELDAIQGEAVGEYTIEFRFSTDEKLKDEGYIYKVEGTHLTFEGAVKRGCMYGVWRFLQNECGWDGLTYGDSILAEAEHINIPDGLTKTATPAFDNIKLDIGFATDRATPNSKQSSYKKFIRANHGISKYCELEVYTEQACFTSEETYQLCKKNVIADIESKLDSGMKIGEDLLDIDIGQCDCGEFCHCEGCREMFEQEGGNSGAVVRFANRLSEEVSQDYPGLIYSIFAYWGTNIRPNIARPNENIYITYCFDHNCSNHVVDGSECCSEYYDQDGTWTNDVSTEWLKGWAEITDNLVLWFYGLDNGLQQYSMIANTYPNFRFFAEIGAKEVFWERDVFGLGIQRVEERLAAEMNWNMNMTEDEFEALLCHILETEYGDGWNDIRAYISMWEEAQNQAPCWHCWAWTWQYCGVPRYSTKYYSENLDRMIELAEHAVSLVNNKAQEKRAELFSCHIYYEGCYSSYYAAEDAGDRSTLKKLEKYYDKMMGILERYGYDPYGEGLRVEDYCRVKYSQRIIGAALYDWINVKDYLTYHEFWLSNPYYD